MENENEPGGMLRGIDVSMYDRCADGGKSIFAWGNRSGIGLRTEWERDGMPLGLMPYQYKLDPEMPCVRDVRSGGTHTLLLAGMLVSSLHLHSPNGFRRLLRSYAVSCSVSLISSKSIPILL